MLNLFTLDNMYLSSLRHNVLNSIKEGNSMKSLTMKQVIEQTNINPTLLRAIVKQHYDWTEFKKSAIYICNYGCVSGISGFIYFNETVGFWKRHKAAIIANLEQMAESNCEGVFDMILNFNGIKNAGLEENESNAYFISKLMNRYNEEFDAFYNLLVWAVVENVAYHVSNVIEDVE